MLRRLGILALIIAAACSYPPLPDLGGGSNGGACLSDIDCEMPGLPICNTDKSTCAPCFAKQNKSSCPSTVPRCDVDTCAACVDDTDCPGSVCMPDGSCADPAKVIHVLVNGQDQAPCGSAGAATACKLDSALMVAANDGTRNVIKLDDAGLYMSELNNFVAASGFRVGARRDHPDPARGGRRWQYGSAVNIPSRDALASRHSGYSATDEDCVKGRHQAPSEGEHALDATRSRWP